MACDPETRDSAANQLKTGHTETHDQQLAAQSPTTRGRQETREQMPEAGDHAARVQEGAKRQESRRLEYPKAKAGPRFRTGGRKKEAAHYHSKNDHIWMCSNHLANSFYNKKSRQVGKKSYVQKHVFRQMTEQLLPVNIRPLLRPLCPTSFGSVGNQLPPSPAPPASMLRKNGMGTGNIISTKRLFFRKRCG